MKKLCAFLLMALLMVPVWAGADDIILPDPGHYFGREYNGSYIEFDEYPYAEYNAYVSLLVNQYGMQIMSAYSGKSDEFYFLQMPDTEYTRTFIWCYQYSDGCGIEAYFDNGISLEPLDVYGQQPDTESPASNSGQIVWDDGRMIADPGDFLGYEIDVTGTWDRTGATLVERAYVEYKYEEIATDDILAYAKALHDSPYFEYNGKGIICQYYWLLYFDYTGANEALLKECKGYRTAKGYGNNRESDLSIYIFSPESKKSEFKVYEYPGFTVDSEFVEPDPDPDAPFTILQTCDVCNGDRKCTYCRGRGTDGITGGDCAVCDRGNCYACGGSGHK